jgi:hypothetical protein
VHDRSQGHYHSRFSQRAARSLMMDDRVSFRFRPSSDARRSSSSKSRSDQLAIDIPFLPLTLCSSGQGYHSGLSLRLLEATQIPSGVRTGSVTVLNATEPKNRASHRQHPVQSPSYAMRRR